MLSDPILDSAPKPVSRFVEKNLRDPYDDIPMFRISHSSMELFNSCPRKFEFQKLWSTTTRDTSLAAEVGHALHSAYQAFVSTGSEEWAIYKLLMRYPWDLNTNSNDARSIEACYATLMHLIRAISLHDLQPVQVKDKHGEMRYAMELGFQFNVKDFSISSKRHIPVVYVGYIDAILYDHLADEYVVVDIKTTRQNMQDYGPKYMLDTQCVPYGIMLEHVLGRPINTLKIKYIVVYVDLEKPTAHVYTFNKTRQDIEDWAFTMVHDLQRMRYMFDMQWWARRGSNCVTYNHPCQFMDTCITREKDVVMNDFYLKNNEGAQRKDRDDISVEFTLDLGLSA